jgi:hypothetical protein
VTNGGDVIPPFFEFQSSRLVIYNPLDCPTTAANVPAQVMNNNVNPHRAGVSYTQNNAYFYSYLDTYSSSRDGYGTYVDVTKPGSSNQVPGSGAPYAYFSSYNTRNGYNKEYSYYLQLTSNSIQYSDCSGLIAYRPDGSVTTLFPYAESNPSASTTNYTYLKPTTFQIISAGRDTIFGCGSDLNAKLLLPPQPVLLWTPQMAASLFPNGTAGYDDQSNFTGSTLGVGQD